MAKLAHCRSSRYDSRLWIVAGAWTAACDRKHGQAKGDWAERPGVHVSEVNTRSKHDVLSYTSILAFQEVAELIHSEVPLILETPVGEPEIEAV